MRGSEDERVGCIRVVMFFFSSRRRHTRFDCDWSSDVCSSDLLLAKFSMQLLNDVSTLLLNSNFSPSRAAEFITAPKTMSGPNQQRSVAQLIVQYGYKGDPYMWERQELMRMAQSRVNPNVVRGSNVAIDQPLFDYFIKQQLPATSDQTL